MGANSSTAKALQNSTLLRLREPRSWLTAAMGALRNLSTLALILWAPILSAAEFRAPPLVGTNAAPSTNSLAQDVRVIATHLLGPGDVVELKVFQEEGLDLKAPLDDQGCITHTLLGRIKLGGKTAQEATALVRELLKKDFLVQPQVSLSLVDIAKARFSIQGKVKNAGIYDIPPDGKLTLLDAVAMAGGFDSMAKVKEVFIKRPSVDNNVETLKVNAAPKKNDKPFEIKPGDTIIVPERAF